MSTRLTQKDVRLRALEYDGELQQPFVFMPQESLLDHQTTLLSCWFIWSAVSSFFSLNPRRLNLTDASGKYGFYGQLWALAQGKSVVVHEQEEHQSLSQDALFVTSREAMERYETTTSLNLGIRDADILLIDRFIEQLCRHGNTKKKALDKTLKAALEQVNFLVINEPSNTYSQGLNELAYEYGFNLVQSVQESWLGVKLKIWAKNASTVIKIPGFNQINQVWSLSDGWWGRAQDCDGSSFYFKARPKPQQFQNYMRAMSSGSVPPVMMADASALILEDVGAEPLSYFSSRRPVDWEKVSTNAQKALKKLHDRGVIHGNINPDSIWLNRETLSVYFMGFDHAITDGSGWTEFHRERWGVMKSSKVDFMGLSEVLTR